MALPPSDAIVVLDQDHPVAFSFEEMLKYAGPRSPGGVAHAFKVLQRALPLLGPRGPVQRREIAIQTAFGGPGARDAFELVTRAVTEDRGDRESRYVVDASLARPERGKALERFVFRLVHGEQSVTLLAREGYVTDEFIALARKVQPSAEDDLRLSALKLEMTDRVMSAQAADVYDVVDSD